MRLARSDIADGLTRLRSVFKPPEVDHTVTLEVWHKALQYLELDAFNQAIDKYIAEDGIRWPKPSQIRRLALEIVGPRSAEGLTGEWHAWCHSSDLGDGVPCPVCGAVLETMPGSQRMGVIHDHDEHMRKNVPYEGPRMVQRSAAPEEPPPDPTQADLGV